MSKPKNINEFIERNRAAIAANPECGTSRYNLAVGLLGLQKYEEAKNELLAAVNCCPTLAEAYVLIGGICLKEGDLEGCLKYNKMAIHSRAGFAEGHGNIGFVYLQMGKLDDAIYHLEKAVRWNPNFLQAFSNLANAYLMQGKIDDSIETNKKALEVEPNFPVAHANLAVAYLEKGMTDLAAEHCDKAVELGYKVPKEVSAEVDKFRS